MKHFGTKRTFERLNQMLDDTMNGTFEESRFDESQLSQLESKWKRYLTSSKGSLQKVEEERASIKELVTDISHQTRTPLANILLYSQLLQEHVQDEEGRQIAAQIQHQSEKLEFLIQSLIKTSRLESGTFQIRPQQNRVMSMVEAAVQQSEKKAAEKKIGIKVTLEEQLTASFDLKWTTEALFNILDNAVKYSPEGSLIQISADCYEMYAVIKVRDQGKGISEEEIPKIFGRFYRGQDDHLEDGVGIGLYLSRQIIEAQSGYIHVLSQKGVGSEFRIFLLR